MKTKHASEEPYEDFGDINDILREFGVLREESDGEFSQDELAADTFLLIVKDKANVSSCVMKLFPSGIPVSQIFFDALSEIRNFTGISESSSEAIGLVWSEAMRCLTTDQREELLQIFTKQKTHNFFDHVGSLQIVVREHTLSAEFLADWFPELLRIVEGDVQDGVWETVRAECDCHVKEAIETLYCLSSNKGSHHFSTAGFMLGVIRAKSLKKEQKARFQKIEKTYEWHEDSQLREVFNWSWVTTFRDGELPEEKLKMLLERSEYSKDDLNNIICVICRSITLGCLAEKHVQQCKEWISRAASPTISSTAKFYIALAVDTLINEGKKSDDSVILSASWIKATQPVPKGDLRTWGEIDHFLSRILKHDYNQFTSFFLELCRISASTIHSLTTDGNMHFLMHALKNTEASDVVGQLTLSVSTEPRKLGLYLFDKLDMDELSKTALETCAAVSPKLLFYETQRTALQPHSIARILAALVPFAEEATDGFHDEFFTELKLQCHNYSGGCRKELEVLAKDAPLVKKLLEEVAGYSETLRCVHEKGINTMEVAGYRQALVQYRRVFSKQVSEHAKSFSPFLSMVKHTQLLYGRTSSQFFDCQLQDALPLIQTSTSMEIPIVDLLDPEGMAFRRLHASAAISALIQQYSDESEKQGE